MPMMHPALTRRTRKEKEQRTTPGGEQAPVLHPQQHDTLGVLIDIPFLVERYIANFGSFAGHFDGWLAGVYLNLYMAKGDWVIGIYMDVEDLLLYLNKSNP